MRLLSSVLLLLALLVNCASESRAQNESAAPATSAKPAPTEATAGKKPTPNPNDRCVEHNLDDVRKELLSDAHRSGPHLAATSYFMPAGGALKVALNEKYNADNRYYAYIDTHTAPKNVPGPFMETREIGASEISSDDALVKSGEVQAGATLLTLNIPPSVGGLWDYVDLYMWRCAENGSPAYVSRLTIATSYPQYSSLIVWPLVFVVYVLGALATSAMSKRNARWYRFLDPVYLTAGSDGKGSLAKLQILFFSLIVFGLVSYILARTGELTVLSSSVLLLLGIAGVGSAAAKGTDEQKNRLSLDNRLWLLGKGWLTSPDWSSFNKAKWRDIVTNDGGEFDVYRYQSCIFSLAVGGALLIGGVSELASFVIPDTLLGILGLSQVVYVGGKLVTTSSVNELDGVLDAARTADKAFLEASLKNADPAPNAGGTPLDIATRCAGKTLYQDYIGKVRSARALFADLTGLPVSDDKLAPTLPA
jgi:hypothetical protein